MLKFFGLSNPVISINKKEALKEEIFEKVQSLEIKAAVNLFLKYRLPFHEAIEQKTTAMHWLLWFGTFDHARYFLRLVKESPDGGAALKSVLVDYDHDEEDYALSDVALRALFREISEGHKTGLQNPASIEKLKAMVHFIIKFTGELPKNLPAFKKCSEEEKRAWLSSCQSAYETLFSKKKRSKWEKEFGVLKPEETASVAFVC